MTGFLKIKSLMQMGEVSLERYTGFPYILKILEKQIVVFYYTV